MFENILHTGDSVWPVGLKFVETFLDSNRARDVQRDIRWRLV